MKKNLYLSFLLFIALACEVAPAAEFTLGSAHYANIVEFWYQKPDPDKLFPLLRTFNEKKLLDRPETQLFFGSFLSRLLGRGEIDKEELLIWTEPLGRTGARICLWAFHLANIPAAFTEESGLLSRSGEIFNSQVKKTPPDLAAWSMDEPAIVNMFWSAFMADGNIKWVERIIETALKLNKSGNDKSANTAAHAAAASLWQYAPRHQKVRQALQIAAAKASGQDKKFFATILKNLQGSQ